MPAYCSRCRGTLPLDAVRPAGGLCEACSAYIERIRNHGGLGEYLEMFRQPVFVSDGDGNVLAANSAMASLTGRGSTDIGGTRFGSSLGCDRSRLTGGCGKTIHCRECTIRRMVSEVSRTRIARRRVPAYIQTEDGREELCITVRPVPGEAVEVVIEDAPPPER